jgi:hypothetical protein
VALPRLRSAVEYTQQMMKLTAFTVSATLRVQACGVDRFFFGGRIHAVPWNCATTHTFAPALVSDSPETNYTSLIFANAVNATRYIRAGSPLEDSNKNKRQLPVQEFPPRLLHDKPHQETELFHRSILGFTCTWAASDHACAQMKSTRHASSTNSRTAIGGARDATRGIAPVTMLSMHMP